MPSGSYTLSAVARKRGFTISPTVMAIFSIKP
jgi:hypothetical protein